MRIQEKGTEHWSFGFEAPVPGYTFADLEPDTENEIQIRSRNASGDSPPTLLTIRTNPEGATTNVVPSATARRSGKPSGASFTRVCGPWRVP